MKIVYGSKFTVIWLSAIILGLVCAGISNAAIIDKDTLELAFLFDQNSGKTTKDSSENGRDGTIISGPKFVKGKFGNALEFDGNDDNIIVEGYFGIGGTEPRTTVFWFQSKDSREHSWVKWGPNVDTQKYYVRAHLAGAECYLRVEVAGGQNYGGDDVCDGKWHHCAVVFPKGSKSVQDHDLYVDGKLQIKQGGDQAMDTDIKQVEVNMGDFLAHHAFMFGLFDEVAIFNVELTPKQIDAIMTDGLAAALAIEPQGKLATRWAIIKAY
jgi:hypothetical protein